MYQETSDGHFIRLSDSAHIPNDPANTDYQSVLAWVAQGNTLLPAVPPRNPRIAQIHARLAQIDLESIRSLRSKAAGVGKPTDDTKLSTLEAEATTLRAELQGLA